jgi:prepilin-type N-terminal cleavage/methylation domain-containing protein
MEPDSGRMKDRGRRDGEQGFTLPEVMITIVVLGILMGIASSTWFSVIESRAVDSAANQLASDLRLAHTRSTNQLANWRVVLLPEKAAESVGPDYYLVKMTSTGDVDSGTARSRTLPDNTKVVGVTSLEDDPAVTTLYSVLGLSGPTRSLEFSPDGSMRNVTVAAGSNEIQVTVDGNPVTRLTFIDVTSRIKFG